MPDDQQFARVAEGWFDQALARLIERIKNG